MPQATYQAVPPNLPTPLLRWAGKLKPTQTRPPLLLSPLHPSYSPYQVAHQLLISNFATVNVVGQLGHLAGCV